MERADLEMLVILLVGYGFIFICLERGDKWSFRAMALITAAMTTLMMCAHA